MAGLASVFGLIHPEREKTFLIPSRRPPEIKEAIRLLESHLDRPWSVQALASIVALSPSQLTRLFTKHAGTSQPGISAMPVLAGCTNFSSKVS